jgi:hypothetical protein
MKLTYFLAPFCHCFSFISDYQAKKKIQRNHDQLQHQFYKEKNERLKRLYPKY